MNSSSNIVERNQAVIRLFILKHTKKKPQPNKCVAIAYTIKSVATIRQINIPTLLSNKDGQYGTLFRIEIENRKLKIGNLK